MIPSRYLTSFFLISAVFGLSVGLSLELTTMAQPDVECTLPSCKPEDNRPVQVMPQGTANKLTPDYQVSKTWWEALGREDVNAFVVSALLNNLELRAKEFEVKAFQQQVKKQFAVELPSASIAASWIRQKNSTNLVSPNASQFRTQGANVFSPGSTFSIFNLPLSVNYELDPFLKNRYATKAMGLRYKAEVLKLHDLELVLAEHSVATLLKHVASDTLIDLMKQKITILDELRHLERSQYEAGLKSQDESLRRLQDLQTAQASLTQLEKENRMLHNELAFIVGKPASSFRWQESETPSGEFLLQLDLTPFASWALIDSNQLIHRPDVAVNELLLQAAGMDVKVARRMFLPTFPITAQIGLASTRLNEWFDWNSVLASFGASVAQQLFAGGSIKANLKEKQARFESAGRLYQNQLLFAGKQTENALVDLAKSQERQRLLEEDLKHTVQRYYLSKVRYESGLSAYTEVLSQELTLVDRMSQQAENRRDLLLAWNHLQRELGGGF
jgi:NodT family efflux transporter outer membrane factor (OMF) lipoprotein